MRLALFCAWSVACVSDPIFDDGGVDGGPCADAGAPKLVFVTSTTVTGDFGMAGGDTKCNDLAAAAGITGNFVAWISLGSTPASSRIGWNGAYAKKGGTRIAACRSVLLGGVLASPIDQDERGTSVTKSPVWTNTNAQGAVDRAGYDCQGFTKIIPDDGGAASAYVGTTDAVDGRWTSTGMALPCSEKARLYCFER